VGAAGGHCDQARPALSSCDTSADGFDFDHNFDWNGTAHQDWFLQ
jgi:hypothetical protein